MAVLFESGPRPRPADDERLAELFAASGTAIAVSHVGPPAPTRVEHWTAGPYDLFLATGDGLRLSRTRAHVRSGGAEALRIGYQSAGRYILRSDDREESGGYGSLKVTDLTRPCELIMAGKGAAAVSFEISFDQLGTRPDVVRQAAGQVHRSPVYGLLQAHMARLCGTVDRPGLADASPLVADATRQLARALILSAAGPLEPGRQAVADVLYERVAEYVVQHLAEPDLTPDRIAAAHNVSLRHLYRLWGRNQTGLAAWITGERLAGAAHDLRDPAAAAVAVATVARKWGFTDPAHISRRFRRANAMSPLEWRHAQLPQPAQDPVR